MQPEYKFKNVLANQDGQEVDFDTVAGYKGFNNFFTAKDGWVAESKSCWSSRDKMVRILPDGLGFNFEVWQVDIFPTLTYCQKLETNPDDFQKQATAAGL